MSVMLSAHARNHMFNIAQILNNDHVEFELVSPYTRSLIKKSGYNIDARKITTDYISLAAGGLRQYINSTYLSDFGAREVDERTASIITKKKISAIHAMNGSAEHSFEAARRRFATTILERSCPHIEFQLEILREEAELIGYKTAKFTRHQLNYWRRMEREYRLSDYICVPSQYSARTFLERGIPDERIKIIPLIAEKRTSYLRQRSRDGDVFRVLSIGGNYLRKGFYYLLDSWRGLALSDAELIIKGPVPLEVQSNFKELKNVKIINNYLSIEELNKLYNSADIFCLPSIDEGFGMVVLEAMNTGLVPIVTKNVGSADLLNNGVDSFVVDIRAADQIAHYINLLYYDRERLAAMSYNARQTAEINDRQAYQKNILNLYKTFA